MMSLDELLAYLEDRIDPAHCESVEKLHVAAMDFKPVKSMPLSVMVPVDKRISPFHYQDAFNDYEKMLFNELAAVQPNVLNSVEIKDDYPLQIRPNYGIGLVASLLGLQVIVREGSMPWVHPVTLDEARKIIDMDVPLQRQLGKKVQECCEFFREKLKPYPKCARYIHITQPDLQGPFDNLHLLLGSEVFYTLVDDPDTAHALLEKITETYIRYRKYIQSYIDDSADEGKKSYVHFGLYGGNVVIKEDTATATISDDMYGEFAAPYNAKVFEAFGNASLHYCGAQKPWHYDAVTKQKINCLNFGNSEMHDWNELYPILLKNKICAVNVGEGQPYGFIGDLLNSKTNISGGLSFMTSAKTKQEALDLLIRHREGGAFNRS